MWAFCEILSNSITPFTYRWALLSMEDLCILESQGLAWRCNLVPDTRISTLTKSLTLLST